MIFLYFDWKDNKTQEPTWHMFRRKRHLLIIFWNSCLIKMDRRQFCISKIIIRNDDTKRAINNNSTGRAWIGILSWRQSCRKVRDSVPNPNYEKRQIVGRRKKKRQERRSDFCMFEVKYIFFARSMSDLISLAPVPDKQEIIFACKLILLIFQIAFRFCHTSHNLMEVLFLRKACICLKNDSSIFEYFLNKKKYFEKIFWNFIYGTEKSAVKIQRVQKMKISSTKGPSEKKKARKRSCNAPRTGASQR